MRQLVVGLAFAIAIFNTMPGAAWGQCDCASEVQSGCQCGCPSECTSGCQCGCNDPRNTEPAATVGPSFFPALNVELLGHLLLSQMGGVEDVLGNDCWGWTDSKSGREFAIFGRTDGTAFVEITDPTNPIYLGSLPTVQGNTTWRDMKVYNNRVYVVADGSGNNAHGVQVMNLSQLLEVEKFPVQFSTDARYTGLGRAHNIAINEETGFAYVVGSSSQNSDGGLIMLDLKLGVMPQLAGVFSADGYTHDVQVVTFREPALTRLTSQFPPFIRQKRELAFCSNVNTLTIVDVSHKAAPQMLARVPYQNSQYCHQGWLSEDHKYFFMDDELDELEYAPIPTRTHVWDVQNPAKPAYIGFHNGTESTIDHNQYVRGNYIFQANYTSGLRILKINDPATASMEEVGYFDTFPANNNRNFNGAWSCYPFFPSGNIIVSDRQNGLFVLRFDAPP